MAVADIRDIGADGRARLRLERTFKAPPAKVFRAWIEPEALKRWFAPNATTPVLAAEVDARVGGRYRIHMRGADGEDNIVLGTYEEILPERRLVFTWHWISTPERLSLVTVEIFPAGTGSRLVLTHERFFDEAGRDRHAQGWSVLLDRLAETVGI